MVYSDVMKVQKRPKIEAMSLLPKRKPVEIEFFDLSYTVQTGIKKEVKVILKQVGGKFRSGRLTAIMGPSGAGKTTLMNIVAGYRVSNVEGSILTNGQKRNIRNFRKMACYIMQDDHHLPHLTVNEAMHVSTNLKLGNSMAASERKEVIREILETLSLTECRDTRTSNLSGGQRKRLSMAVELVNNPPVMFFDEPTSGLDSQNSFQCINLLNSLAKEGRTIICTIHQPSARLFEKFDYLYALSEGHCIYRGAVTGLLPFLSSIDLECPSYHNPADFLIEVATSGDYTQKLSNAVTNGKCSNLVKEDDKPDFCPAREITAEDNCRNILKSIEMGEQTAFLHEKRINDTVDTVINVFPQNGKKEDLYDEMEMFSTSTWRQFIIILKRNYISILRDSMLTKLRLSSHIVVGLLIGCLYYNIGNEASNVHNNAGFLFCCILFTIFAGMMPTLLTFPLEMKVFIREHHNCWYSLKSYYLAKTMADFPFQILYPVLYVLIVYFLSNQPYEVNRFCMFTTMCVMTSLVAQSLALVIGAALEIQEATFFAPVVSIPILLFSGFFVTFSTIPIYLRWITYLSYMRYAFEGALLSIYSYDRVNLDCAQPYCHFRSPSKFLEKMELQDADYWVDFIALWGFFIGLRIVGYFVLRWKLRVDR